MKVRVLKKVLSGIDDNCEVWVGKEGWTLNTIHIDTDEMGVSLISTYEEDPASDLDKTDDDDFDWDNDEDYDSEEEDVS